MKEIFLGFIEGAGRALDLAPEDEPIMFHQRDPSGDARNLAKDWHRIAGDLNAAWDFELGKREA